MNKSVLFSGLSVVAMSAPSEKFLNMGGPLAAGLGVVFVSSLGKFVVILSPPLGWGDILFFPRAICLSFCLCHTGVCSIT